jgi:tetratricopeptide (TPR) repeat protein
MRYTVFSIFFLFLSSSIVASDHRAYHHYMLGEMHVFEDEYESAISEYVKASVYDSNSAYIRVKIASAYMQMGNTEFALYNVKRALELDPVNTDGLILYSEILLLNEDLQKAAETCSIVLETEPDNKLAIQCKVSALVGLKKYKEGLKTLKDYSELNPYDENALYGTALIYNLMSKTEEAESYYLKALKINNKHLPSVIDLMDLYLKNYNTDDYLKKMNKLAEISNLKILRDKLIRTYTSLGIQNRSNTQKSSYYYKKAIEQLDILSAEHPENSNIIMQKALLLEENGETEKAILSLEKALETFSNDERLMTYLASMYQKVNKPDLALPIMEKILLINPDNPDALNYVAYSYAEMNRNLDKAKIMITRALKIVPDDPYVTDSLGWIYHKMGDNKNAAITLERALSLAEKRRSFEPEMIEHLIDVYIQLGFVEKIKQVKQTLLDSETYVEHRDKILQIFQNRFQDRFNDTNKQE